MPLKIAVQMDDIKSIDIQGDSTFALLLEAQARKHNIFYYLPKDLSLLKNKLYAYGHDINVKDDIIEYYNLSDGYKKDLSECDVILMRQDPPFNMNYITITHLLEKLPKKSLVVNNPYYVRNCPEKLFAMDFPELMPPTLITRSKTEIIKFRELYKDIIIKPLYGNGGAGIFRITYDDENFNSLIEMFESNLIEPFMIQRYMPEVKKGDKRIILIDGQAVGAINRIPGKGETRSNMHVGGQAKATEITTEEQKICDTIGPKLKEMGLIFVGIDVIGNKLTEINVTSPTGIREVKKFSDIDIAKIFWDTIEKKVYN